MRTKWLLTAAMGLGLLGGVASYSHADAEEGKEVKVKLTDCPKAVQETIKEQTKSAKAPVESVDKLTAKDGTVTYEADATIGGTPYEILVAADGKFISKNVDKEEVEKKDGKGDKDKEDKK